MSRRKRAYFNEEPKEETEYSSPEPLAVEGAPDTEPKKGIVIGQLVNVRDAPEANSRVLTLVQKGAKVTILGYTGHWYKISINDTSLIGYIVSDFVAEV